MLQCVMREASILPDMVGIMLDDEPSLTGLKENDEVDGTCVSLCSFLPLHATLLLIVYMPFLLDAVCNPGFWKQVNVKTITK